MSGARTRRIGGVDEVDGVQYLSRTMDILLSLIRKTLESAGDLHHRSQIVIVEANGAKECNQSDSTQLDRVLGEARLVVAGVLRALLGKTLDIISGQSSEGLAYVHLGSSTVVLVEDEGVDHVLLRLSTDEDIAHVGKAMSLVASYAATDGRGSGVARVREVREERGDGMAPA
jgi:hypothetical protein